MVHFRATQFTLMKGRLEDQSKLKTWKTMVGDAIDCLKWAKFGGKFIEVYRGLKEDDWIFNDEADVKKLLPLSEFGKEASGMS